MSDRRAASCLALSTAGLAGSASAHTFAPPYTMPVPFSMYAFGSGAALLLSFLIVGLFVTAPARPPPSTGPGPDVVTPPERLAVSIAKAASVFLLLLCILTGLLGTQNPYANFNMTFFWIVFVLGVPYLTFFVGDFFAAVNPWRAIVDAVESALGRRFDGVVPDAQRFGYYPALLLYMLFIWVELFARLTPQALSIALLAYTLVNLAGAWLFGKSTWFRHGEFFGVGLRLIGMMSIRGRPWSRSHQAPGPQPRRWRAPFVGLMDARAEHVSLLVFILFMLSSTAFDGLHGTQPWVAIFWKGIYPAVAPYLSAAEGQQYKLSTTLYYWWQWLSLAVSPLAYLAVFGLCVAAANRIAGATTSVREVMLRLAFALVPIAFAYHVTHYFTMLVAQGAQIVRLVSDPFGKGWNLLGTARLQIDRGVIEVNVIWHAQVALILVGHVASVYLAHVEALRIAPDGRHALLSQLPLLLLMVAFTAFGLWILSLPLSIGG